MFRPTIIVLREVHIERVEEDSMKTEAGLHLEVKGGGEILFPGLRPPSFLVVLSCFIHPVFIAETLTFSTAM